MELVRREEDKVSLVTEGFWVIRLRIGYPFLDFRARAREDG